MRHPVTLTLSAAIVLVLIGIYFVERERGVVPNGATASWGANSGYVETLPATPADTESVPLPETSGATGTGQLVIPGPQGAAKKPTVTIDGTVDFVTLLAELRRSSGPKASAASQSTYQDLVSAFSFTPEVTAIPAVRVRTPEQEALYTYGNEVGRKLQAFVAINQDVGKTVGDQAANRGNEAANNGVRTLGNRYRSLGESILSMENVPSSIESTHKELGESYVKLGSALSLVPDAKEDQDFLAAITKYNSTADSYTSAFVNMVTFFSVNNVTFDEFDPGAAFRFSRN